MILDQNQIQSIVSDYIDKVRLKKSVDNHAIFQIFNENQIEQINYGIQKYLPKKYILICANPEYNEKQMQQILIGFLIGLSEKQVLLYAKPDIHFMEMFTIRQRLEPEFNMRQLEQITLGVKNLLPDEYVMFYANSEFCEDLMEQIRLGFEKGLTIEQVSLYANKNLSIFKVMEIKEGLLGGLSIEKVSVYADPKLSRTETYIIKTLFLNNKDIDVDDIKWLINSLHWNKNKIHNANINELLLLIDKYEYVILEHKKQKFENLCYDVFNGLGYKNDDVSVNKFKI